MTLARSNVSPRDTIRAIDARRRGEMEQRRKIQRARFRVIARRANVQHITATDHLVHRPESELRQDLTHFLGDEEKVIHDVLGLTGEARAQLRILGCDSNGAGVEMTLAHHHTAFDDERRGGEPELVGATLSGEIARRYGDEGLPDGSISFRFTGSAGQSFGAFAARGLTLELEGEANDYVGKGLSGGRLIVRHPRAAQFIPDQTVLIGNTVLYGATSGEAYFAGVAGERFAVRNSGAMAVVEGVGDHGCEYMTGGTVVVLGRTGRNFGAGMSGGIAFVLDEFELLATQCNPAMVDLIPLADFGEREQVRHLIEQHARYTGSACAKRTLGQWDKVSRRFVVVIPREYRNALQQRAEADAMRAVSGARHRLAIVDARSDRHG